MTTINPCPFCGYDDVEIDEVGVSEYAVTCPECRCIGPICGTVMESISTWNDRRGQPENNVPELIGFEITPINQTKEAA